MFILVDRLTHFSSVILLRVVWTVLLWLLIVLVCPESVLYVLCGVLPRSYFARLSALNLSSRPKVSNFGCGGRLLLLEPQDEELELLLELPELYDFPGVEEVVEGLLDEPLEYERPEDEEVVEDGL